jgi:signal transduction histidine kinase
MEEDDVELLLERSKFTLINSSFSSQAGEPIEIGDPLWKGFNSEMLPIYLTKVVKNGYFEGIEKNNVMGRIRVFELSMIRIDDERGICGIKGLRKDITKSIRMQRRLERSKAKMELYLDLLSHDISNINTVSQGFLELLLTMDDLNDISKRYLKSCLNAIQKSSQLVSKVKILSRIESDLENIRPVDLQPVIKHVLESMRKEYPDKTLSVQMIKDDSNMAVTCDDLIVDMVWHVIENAVMHDPSNDVSIDIQYEKYNLDGTEGSLVSFSDRGPGIPNEDKSHIFNRKERKEDVRPGKGLGLVIINGIVNRYGGTIWLEDRVMGDSGKGVKFSIFLPD